MSLAFCSLYDLLICGSRESGLSIYSLDSSKEDSIRELSPIIYLRKTHGKQAVTSVALRVDKLKSNDNKDIEEVLMIYTSGRDGGYIKYRLRGLSSKDTRKELKTIEIDGAELFKNNETGLLKDCDEDTDEEDNIDGDNIDDVDDASKESSKKKLVLEDGLMLEQVYRAKVTKGWLEKVSYNDTKFIEFSSLK